MRSTEKQTVFQALVDLASDSSFHQIEMLHLSSHVVSSLQLNPMSNAHELSTEVSKCKKMIVWRSRNTVATAQFGDTLNWCNASVLWVRCMQCTCVLKWKSKDGTSGLSSHYDACCKKLTTGTRKLSDLPSMPAAVPKVPSHVKSDLADTLVWTCAKGIRLASDVKNFCCFCHKVALCTSQIMPQKWRQPFLRTVQKSKKRKDIDIRCSVRTKLV